VGEWTVGKVGRYEGETVRRRGQEGRNGRKVEAYIVLMISQKDYERI
jgi:hypothetical protein